MRRSVDNNACGIDEGAVRARIVALVFAMLGSLVPRPVQAQGAGLVVPVPAPERVAVAADSFTNSAGLRRQFDVYRPAGTMASLPVVVFANAGGPALRQWRSYVDWARLVTSRDLAGVLYEGPGYDPARSLADNLSKSIADLDSVLGALRHRGSTLRVDGARVVIWAGSSQTFTGTPVSLDGSRDAIKGYVLYYGAGTTADPRLDVPVFIARAGLDSPGLNRGLDSLSAQLIEAGVPVTVVNYPSGRHAFDIADSTAMSARVIAQTLDFMSTAVDPALQSHLVATTQDVRAMRAFVAERWPEAVRLYGALASERTRDRTVAWRLGLAQLANDEPAAALASFNRARELGQGGARDIGLPATRAALRSGERDKAAEWLLWAVRSFPAIRGQVADDTELAPLLNHPLLRGGGS
jgi:dienelactone hydrolase